MVGLPQAALLAWTILLAPLAAAVLIQLAGVHRPKLSASLAIAGLFTGFLCAVRLFLHARAHHDALPFESSAAWIAFLRFARVPDKIRALIYPK